MQLLVYQFLNGKLLECRLFGAMLSVICITLASHQELNLHLIYICYWTSYTVIWLLWQFESVNESVSVWRFSCCTFTVESKTLVQLVSVI